MRCNRVLGLAIGWFAALLFTGGQEVRRYLLTSCKNNSAANDPLVTPSGTVPASYPPTAAGAESCWIFSKSASDRPIRIGSTPRPFITSAVL